MAVWSIGLGKRTKELVKQICSELATRYPPGLQSSKVQKISVNRVTRLLEDSYSKAVRFRDENKLGAMRIASLGNSFRWELTELGYTKEFVEMATEGLIVYLTRKSAEAELKETSAKQEKT